MTAQHSLDAMADNGELIAEVERASEELGDVAARLETAFLQTADDVMAITESSQLLVSGCERLSELAIGKASGTAVMDAVGVVRPPLEFLASASVRMQRVIELLQSYHDQLRRTLRWERDFLHIMQPMVYVRTLLRIEAAGLDAENAQLLLDLVRDIEALQERVETIFGEQFHTLHDTYDTLGELIVRIRQQTASNERVATAKRNEVANSIRTMEEGVKASETRDTNLESISREVSAQVSRVVMAMQFQDIVNQKLSHVRETVQQIEPHSGAVIDPDGTSDAGSSLRFVQYAGKVLLGQIEFAEIELTDADEVLQSGLNSIVDRMRALDQACITMHDVRATSSDANGFVQVMLDALGQVAGLLESGNALTAELHDVIRPITLAASSTGVRLGELSKGMHMVGLNAEVQAARIGGSGGIEVLSARTSAIAREAGSLSEEVSANIEGLVFAITEVGSILQELEDEGARHAERVRADGAAVETLLHEFRDETLKDLTLVGQLTLRVSDQVRPLLERRAFTELFADELADFRTAIAELIDTACEEANHRGVPDDAAHELLEAMASHYTMASERRQHDAAIEGTSAAIRRDERGGSADLFDEAPVTTGNSGGDVELF